VRRLAEAARLAPSPDNNQPWRFRPTRGGIEVWHVRDRAIRSDVRDMFSWLALGAAIENLVLAAGKEGICGEAHYLGRPFPESARGEHVCTVRLAAAGREPDELGEFLAQRHTNRRKYSRDAVEVEQLERIAEALRNPGLSLLWITGKRAKREVATLVRMADRIRFECQGFHEELHGSLRLTSGEAATGEGLPFEALEVPGIMRTVLRFLRPWSRMRLLNRLGASRVFARMSAQAVRASGAIGLLMTRSETDEGYLEAGRGMQRVWLAATRERLALQPLGGLPLFLTRLVDDPCAFSPAHATRLRAAGEGLRKVGDQACGGHLVMLFRIGRAEPASGRAGRLRVSELLASDAGEKSGHSGSGSQCPD
jgi:nitroreductase